MQYALREAEKAFEANEVPVGCIIVFRNTIIAKSYNQIETLKDPTAHCEILAITSAAEYLQSKQLIDCSMYVTLEPCTMCAGAIVLSKLESGACGTVLNITNNKSLNHKCNVYGGLMDYDCGEILKSFFKDRRQD